MEPGQQGSDSNHMAAFIRARLPRLRSFEWTTHQYRYYNEESEKQFGSWLAAYDWAVLVQSRGSNRKAEIYQEVMLEALERFFPLVRVRRKTSDCPWINDKIRGLITDRKEIYGREGKSDKWRNLRDHILNRIAKRKENYLESQRSVLLVNDARRNFFRNVNPIRPRSFFQFRPFRPRGRKRPMEVSFLNFKNILKIIKK